MNNIFENLVKNLDEFKNTKNPEDRLFYINSVEDIISMGKRFYALKPNEELKQSIDETIEMLGNYKLYPKL